jgi:hypothetical protein
VGSSNRTYFNLVPGVWQVKLSSRLNNSTDSMHSILVMTRFLWHLSYTSSRLLLIVGKWAGMCGSSYVRERHLKLGAWRSCYESGTSYAGRYNRRILCTGWGIHCRDIKCYNVWWCCLPVVKWLSYCYGCSSIMPFVLFYSIHIICSNYPISGCLILSFFYEW